MVINGYLWYITNDQRKINGYWWWITWGFPRESTSEITTPQLHDEVSGLRHVGGEEPATVRGYARERQGERSHFDVPWDCLKAYGRLMEGLWKAYGRGEIWRKDASKYATVAPCILTFPLMGSFFSGFFFSGLFVTEIWDLRWFKHHNWRTVGCFLPRNDHIWRSFGAFGSCLVRVLVV